MIHQVSRPADSWQLDLNQRIQTLRMAVDIRDAQAGAFHQSMMLRPSTMLRTKSAHQREVERRLSPVRALVGHHEVIDEYLGVALLHCRNDGFENLRVHVVVPVLDDRVEIVSSCACTFESALFHLQMPMSGSVGYF